jgi:hypothetical protein
MAIGWMWDYQVVRLSGVPEQDEATLNQFGLIGYELVAVVAMGGLVAYSRRRPQTSRHKRRQGIAIPLVREVLLQWYGQPSQPSSRQTLLVKSKKRSCRWGLKAPGTTDIPVSHARPGLGDWLPRLTQQSQGLLAHRQFW